MTANPTSPPTDRAAASRLPPELVFVERLNLALGAAMTVVGGIIWGRAGLLAAGAGAALACADFWALVRLARRAFALYTGGGTRRQVVRLVAALMLKLLGLFALVWLAMGVVRLLMVPFALGISVFVVSILVLGVGQGLRQSPPEGPVSDHEVPKKP